MLTHVARTLAACAALSLVLACSVVGVYGSADFTLFRWTGNALQRQEKLAVSAQPSLIGTSWLAEDIGGRGVIDNAQTTITLDAEGRVAGSGGCNRYFGPVTIEGSTIRFGDLGATRMACVPALMDQEQKFFDALAATRSSRFDDLRNKLMFLGENGASLVRFSPFTP